ncbi:hypothetical protein GS444_24225 [Rhodococcus hoagii]|nr:hypothetical protein [Prescottella equi]
MTEQLDLFRSSIVGRTDARPAVDALEKLLLDVMCRTERPTTEARSMVDERAVLVTGSRPTICWTTLRSNSSRI